MTGTDSRTYMYSEKLHNQKHSKLWFNVTQNVISRSVKRWATPSCWYYKDIYTVEAYKSKPAKPHAQHETWCWLRTARDNSHSYHRHMAEQPSDQLHEAGSSRGAAQRDYKPHTLLSATGSAVCCLTPASASFIFKHSPNKVRVNHPLWTRRKILAQDLDVQLKIKKENQILSWKTVIQKLNQISNLQLRKKKAKSFWELQIRHKRGPWGSFSGTVLPDLLNCNNTPPPSYMQKYWQIHSK